ncbi:hypothetical protein Y032_0105g3714 [Ancylostoma ceylanicum]|uniref:Peptidase M13 N-terminal domain-containing protein n=1 Tax=Ancylostoma ceylanicum TaxID=53326 RepID=A0A016TGC9_9BILA|nr:hypothetical protein Y032_0105g3714 [Ancylostoma ceylanicum]
MSFSAQLESTSKSESKAIEMAKALYSKCMHNTTFDGRNSPGKGYLLNTIRSFSHFPVLPKNASEEDDLQLHKLLAHFNFNKSVVPLLVPVVGINRYDTSKNIITFEPRVGQDWLLGTNANISNASLDKDFLYKLYHSAISSVVEADESGDLTEADIQDVIKDVLDLESKISTIFSSILGKDQQLSNPEETHIYRLSEIKKEMTTNFAVLTINMSTIKWLRNKDNK